MTEMVKCSRQILKLMANKRECVIKGGNMYRIKFSTKIIVFILLISYIILLSGCSDNSETINLEQEEDLELKVKLIGVWQDDSCVGATYSNMYHFYEDNTFEYFYSFYDEERRDFSNSGEWLVYNNMLHLKISQKTIREGGKFVESPLALSGYSLVDCELVKQDIDPIQEIIYPIKNYKESTTEYPTSISIGGTDFWQLSVDPHIYTE